MTEISVSLDLEPDELYRRYLKRCNQHRFGELSEFVADEVQLNGETIAVETYGKRLHAVVEAFPDYSWQLHHLAVDPPWLAAHLLDRGTHHGPFHGVPATGRTVTTQEFAFYRIAAGKISEVWVTGDDLSTFAQLGWTPGEISQ